MSRVESNLLMCSLIRGILRELNTPQVRRSCRVQDRQDHVTHLSPSDHSSKIASKFFLGYAENVLIPCSMSS